MTLQCDVVDVAIVDGRSTIHRQMQTLQAN